MLYYTVILYYDCQVLRLRLDISDFDLAAAAI